MTIGGAPIGGSPIAGGPTIIKELVSTSIRGAPVSVLVHIDVKAGGGVDNTVGGIGYFAIGEGAIAEITGDPSEIGITTLRYADTSYISEPTDDPADTYYSGRAKQPSNINREIVLSPESQNSGKFTGTIEIINEDGILDNIVLDNAIDGQTIEILVGNTDSALSTFEVVTSAIGVNWENTGRTVKISYQDASYFLDVPIQQNFYAGTGQVGSTGETEGDVELFGRPKPYIGGQVNNVLATLVDHANLIYQVQDGSLFDITNVYDQGLALTDEGDTDNLYNGSTTTSQYRTDKTHGLFQLGGSPNGTVTADVQGDNSGSGYVSTIPDILLKILQDKINVPSRFLDAGSFTDLAAAIPGTAGFYISERTTGRELMSLALKGIGASSYSRRTGKITVYRLTEPDPDAVVIELDDINIISVTQKSQSKAIYPPNWRRTVGYAKNWEVMTSDIAGAVSDERRHFLASEWSTTVNTDATVTGKHTQATDPPLVKSNFINKTDADTLASDLMGLHSVDRQLLEVTVKSEGLDVDMGQTVRITYDRFGLGGGKIFRAWPIKEDMALRQTILLCWG